MLNNKPVTLQLGIVLLLSSLCVACARSGVEDGERTAEVHAPFDSGAWKRGAPEVRSRMAGDLVNRAVLNGKTRAEVKALLGEPDQEGPSFLRYDVLSAAGNAPAYAIRVELDPHSGVAREAHIDTDTGAGYTGPD